MTVSRQLLEFFYQSYAKAVPEIGSMLGIADPKNTRVADNEPPLNDHWSTGLYESLQAAVRYRRVTPSERWPAHRAYPSPRGAFAATARYRVHEGASDILFGIDVSRVPMAYGDLRPALAWAEAGHLCATIQLLCENQRCASRLSWQPEGPVVEQGFVPLSDRFIRAVVADFLSIEALLDARTSNPMQHFGLVPMISAEKTLAELLDIARCALVELETFWPTFPKIMLHGLVLDGRRIRQTSGEEIAVTTGKSVADGINFLSGIGIQLSTDPRLWTDNKLRSMHFAVGWISQWICVAAAARNHAARPVRGFDEAAWAAASRLPFGVSPIYQVWMEPRVISPFETLIG